MCKFGKSIFGLKKTPILRYFHLHKKCVELVFYKLNHDESAWPLESGRGKIFIMSYVDDIVLISGNDTLLADTKKLLTTWFKMRAIGILMSYLEW